MAYVPLWCKSNFSFLEGAGHPEDLVEWAHGLGLPAVAVTDRDGVYGAVRAHVRARELGIRLLVGAQVAVGGRPLVLLAADRDGYANLCRALTDLWRTGRLDPGRLCERARGLLALWTGGQGLWTLREAFGDRLYALAARHRAPGEPRAEAALRRAARRAGVPVAAGVEVLYPVSERRPLQDVLTCVRHKVTLAGAGRRLRPNANHALPEPGAFARLFADDPAGAARTREIADRCGFDLGQLRYRYPEERLPGGATPSGRLRALTWEGARRRYGGRVPAAVREQVQRELAVIDELDYGGYFLTLWEIVRFCRDRGILCQGRGSAANSAVCYCLGITAVDPVRMGLLFERFLSRERAEPPDIDLDIMHERREEVIRHVYAVHGPDRAALVATTVRYRARSAVRDVGRTLGLPDTALDRLCRAVSGRGPVDAGAVAEAGLDPAAPALRHLVRLAGDLLGFPRHRSTHPGGFLLGHEPLHRLVPLEPGGRAGRTVIQWDKDDVEALGLFKVDLLGLGALSQLDRAFRLLEAHRGLRLSLDRIPPDDPATFDMLCAGDAVGVFQLESRAQMAMLPRLRPRTYYDLVIQISLVRPGPIAGGMVHPYLRRRSGEEPMSYPHPCLEPVLAKTLGVPLFQEQVMRLAMAAADYTPGEADQLRRDMGAWRRTGRIARHRDRLVGRMVARGIDRSFAEGVFEQIQGFGEYGFPESHAASFALLAYATAWLRRHHPEVFLCSLLNAQPMGFYSPATLVDDARRRGVRVLPADVCHSGWDSALESIPGRPGRFAVRLGLRTVKGLSRDRDARAVLAARGRAPFAGPGDFARRTGLGTRALRLLAEAGALNSLEPDRRAALWEALGRPPRRPDALPLPAPPPPGLPPLGPGEAIRWDHAATGLSPRGHPLEPLRDLLAGRGLPDARAVRAARHETRLGYAGMVICRQRPAAAAGVTFLTLEDETGFVNVVVWKRVADRHGALLATATVLGVTGRIRAERGVVHLVADRLWDPGLPPVPAPASRDFR